MKYYKIKLKDFRISKEDFDSLVESYGEREANEILRDKIKELEQYVQERLENV